MGFRNTAYATVWSVEEGRGNFTKCRISVSRKNRDTGEYEQDFSGFVMMIGPAHAKAQRLHERDRIRLKEVDVSNHYDKERNREFIDYKCFDFEFADDNGASAQAPADAPSTQEPEPVEGDEELPF